MADMNAISIAINGADNLSGPAGTAAGSLGKLEAAAGRGVGALAGMAEAAAKAAVAVAAITFGAVAAGMASAVTVAASFEQQLSAIAAVSSKAEVATVGGMKAIGDAALQLGKDTSFSATEAAAGMEEMVKAGVSLTDVMGGGARAALDLAAAGALSVSEAATVASNAMNAFALSGKDLPHIADLLAGAAVASATDVHQLGFALASVGAVAHGIGFTLDDTTTAVSLLAQAGLKGSDSGTSLKAMLNQLSPTSKTATAEMERLGIITTSGARSQDQLVTALKGSEAGQKALSTMQKDGVTTSSELYNAAKRLGLGVVAGTKNFDEWSNATADVSNQFFDAEGNVKSMAEVSDVLANATANLTKEEKIKALVTLFGTDGERAALILSEQRAEGINKMAEAQRAAGGASAIAAERLNNLKGSLEKLGGTWEVIRIKFGTPFLPILKQGVDLLTEALNKNEPSITAFAERMAAGLDKLVAKVPAALSKVGKFFTDLGQTVGALVGLELSDYTGGWVTWGGIVTRILDLVGAGARTAFTTLKGLFSGLDFGGAAGGASSFIGGLVGAFKQIEPVVMSVGRAVVANITETFRFLQERVLPPVVSMVQQLGAVLERTLLPAAAATGAVMRGIFGDTLDWLAKTVFPPFLSIIEQTSNFFTGTILPTLPAVGAALRTALGETVQWLAADIWPKLTVAAGVAWGYISGTIVPALPAFARQVREVVGGALAWVAETGWPTFLSAARTAWRFVSGTILPAIPNLARQFREVLGTAIVWVAETGWPTLVSAGRAVSEWITGTAIPALTQLVDWLGPKINAVVTWVTTTGWPTFVTTATAVSDWITSVAVPAFTALVDWLGPKVSDVVTWLSEVGWPTLVMAATAVSDWVTTVAIPAVTDLVAWLGPKVADVVTWLTQTGWPGLVTAALAVSDWITNTAVPALTSLVDWLGPKINDAVTWLTQTGWPGLVTAGEPVAAFFTTVTEWATKFWAQIVKKGVVDDLSKAFDALWTAGAILVDRFWPETTDGATKAFTATDVFVTLIKGASQFLLAFATGIEAIAKGFVALKDAIDSLPQWVQDGMKAGSGIFGPGAGLVAPFLPQAPGAAPQRQPGSSGGGTTQQTPQSYAPGSWEEKSYNAAVKANHPNPTQFVEQMRWESGGFDPDVISGRRDSSAGARGIAQIMPLSHPGVDPLDPDAALAYAANLMRQHYETFNGNSDEALAAYNGGRGAVSRLRQGWPAQETTQYLQNINQRTTEAQQRTPVAPMSAVPGSGQGLTNFQQTQREWSSNAAYAAGVCGPRLASLFADAVGRPPTPEEAVALGESIGIFDRNNPMIKNAAGFDEYATALIRQTNPGSTASVQQQMGVSNAQATGIASESLAGGASLTGFNTQGHYFGADQFDPTTGKFHVGGTGLSAGGGEWMSVDEMTSKMGPLLGVLTLVGETATTSSAQVTPLGDQLVTLGDQGATSAEGLTTVAAAAAATTPELSAIGAAIDPVVASMDMGTTSVSGMTDAIIASAAGAGVATASAASYAAGLTTQDAALRAVLEGFAATTPAAAALLAQLDAGTISTDQAAIAFAGLATTTAVSTGALTASTVAMTTGVLEQFGLMSEGATLATTTMGTNTLTTVTDTAGNMVTTWTDAAGNIIDQTLTMADGTVTHATTMAEGTIEQAKAMADGTTENVTTMSEEAQAQALAMAEYLIGQAQVTQDDATAAAQQMQEDVVSAVSDMATGAGEQFDSIKEPAQNATTAMEAVGEVEIGEPDVSGVINAMKKVQKAAEKASSAVATVGGKGGKKSGGGHDDDFGKAVGGWAEGITLVGEHGPELASFKRPTWITTATQTRNLLNRGGDGSTGGSGRGRHDVLEIRIDAERIFITGRDIAIKRGTISAGSN